MVGKKIQHYEILHELGRGGMGTVYEAADSRLGRRVAIKVLPREATRDSDQVRRFKREAQTASALNHPGIVTIFDIVESHELHCIVMELIKGRTIRDWMGDRPGVEECMAVCAQIARALSAAHGEGIVHRDIKPDNIMIRDDGIVKMLDFGVAKLIDHSRLTREGAVIGTVSHMSPEQTRGEHVDDRTDVWSLGVVLYEALTGQRPFAADYDQAVVYNILNTPATPVTDVRPGTPQALATLVSSMLDKDPGKRPSAQQVADVLTSVIGGPGSPAEPKPLEADGQAKSWAAHEDRRPVAVLPFKIHSGGTDHDFLSLALAEAVSHGLSSNPELVVRPTSAVVKYAEGEVDPMVVARDLRVAVVVEGSIQTLGPNVRVQVQAWDATRDSTLLSVKLDGHLDDLFGLQDRVADRLGEGMGLDHVATAARRPTRSTKAYELFLRATERLLRYDQAGTTGGIEMLRSAVELDPRFAEAWSRLSVALVYMGTIIDPRAKWYEEAESAVEKALALDATNAEAWTARGRLLWTPRHGFQHASALRDLGKACCQPSCPADAPLWRGVVLAHVGLHEEALMHMRQARESQPDDLLAALTIGETLGWHGDTEGNLELMREVLAGDPVFPFGHLFMPVPLLYLDRLEEAEAAIRTGKEIVGGDSMILASEALLWAKRGEPERTRQSVQVVHENLRSVSHVHHTHHYVAAAHATIGDAERAVAELRTAAEAGMPNYPAFVNDPHFASLHDQPDFKELMSGLKTGWETLRAEFGADPGSTL
jgi:serine/threonine-protein kinase